MTAPARPVKAQTNGIWISRAEIAALPMSGAAWSGLLSEANASTGTPNLSNQDDPVNVRVMAKALAFARTGNTGYRNDVVNALRYIAQSGSYSGRALALGRELGAYVIAADVIDLKSVDPSLDQQFRAKIRQLLTTPTDGGPSNLVDCHEKRANNWGTQCGGSRAVVAAYLGDAAELARVAQVFKGWLGDRTSYAGFDYGDLAWQSDPSRPVGINPKGATIQGRNVDGVVPDDQRREGGFSWPPPKANYVYGALGGVLVQALILHRAGYPAFEWSDRAILRAFVWTHEQANFAAQSDDSWQPHLVNHIYSRTFPAQASSGAGKNVGWTDWTHGGRTAVDDPPDEGGAPNPPANLRIVP